MRSRSVVIVGGGIAGLTTAFALQEQARGAGLALTCTVIESAPVWGGKIATHRIGDTILEAGPDSFLSQKPAGLELCRKLGLLDQVINTNETNKRTFVYSRGRLRQLPEGLVMIVPRKLGPFLRSGLLSWGGMVRMGFDLVIPAKRDGNDESLSSFFCRRFGREAFERFIEPLMAGIYAGDAGQMSVQATFPRFHELERQHGGLIRGMLRARAAPPPGGAAGSGTARTMFVTLRDGLTQLTGALVERIGKDGATLLTGRTATEVRIKNGGTDGTRYDVVLAGGGTVPGEAVVLATPAYVSARLLRPINSTAADLLDRIPYASTMTISLIYETAEASGAVRGFGFVVPRAEGSDVLAVTNSSLKWPHRTPPNLTAIRCYLGGMGRESLLSLDDQELIRRARRELERITGLTAEPAYAEVNRWERAMPQYTLGHLERLQALQQTLVNDPGLYLIGAAYRGIGIPDCIRDGTEAAAAMVRDWCRP